jgi:hypothetical protein
MGSEATERPPDAVIHTTRYQSSPTNGIKVKEIQELTDNLFLSFAKEHICTSIMY